MPPVWRPLPSRDRALPGERSSACRRARRRRPRGRGRRPRRARCRRTRAPCRARAAASATTSTAAALISVRNTSARSAAATACAAPPGAPGRSRPASPRRRATSLRWSRQQAGARGRRRREEGHAAAGDGVDRPRPKTVGMRSMSGFTCEHGVAQRSHARGVAEGWFTHGEEECVGDEHSIRTQIPRYVLRRLRGRSHADDRLRLHRRYRRPLPSPDHDGGRHVVDHPEGAPTVSVTEAPAMPPPQRRQPTVVTPVSTASSR